MGIPPEWCKGVCRADLPAANSLSNEVQATYKFDVTLPELRLAIDGYSFNTVRNAIVERKTTTTFKTGTAEEECYDNG